MTRFSPASPIGFIELLLRDRFGRARAAQQRGDVGASAVEWVVISAIVVGIAIAIGGILLTALENKAKQVEGEIGGVGGP